MMIVGQDFGNAQRAQRDHRSAIGQAVRLVGPGLLQGKSGVEVGTGLR
jgi:hypothetical protein